MMMVKVGIYLTYGIALVGWGLIGFAFYIDLVRI